MYNTILQASSADSARYVTTPTVGNTIRAILRNSQRLSFIAKRFGLLPMPFNQDGQFGIEIQFFESGCSEVKRAGAELRALARGPGGRRFVRRRISGLFLTDSRRFFDAITFAGDADDLGMMQEPVQNGPGGGHVA